MSIHNRYALFRFLSLLAISIMALSSCVTTGTGTSTSGANLSVDVTSVSEYDDRFVVLLEADASVTYTPYRLESPLRLVVDIPDAEFVESGTESIVDNVTITEIKKLDYDSDGISVARLEIYLSDDTNYYMSKPQDNQVQVEIQKIDPSSISSETADDIPYTADDSGTPSYYEISEPEKTVWDNPATKIINIVTDSDADGTSVTILGDGAMLDYETFVLDDPNRLVIDFSGISSNYPNETIPVESADISAIKVGIHPDKVRIVLESDNPTMSDYNVYPVDNKLMVVFREGTVGTPANTGSVPTETRTPTSDVVVTGVDVRTDGDISSVVISTTGSSDFTAKMVSERSIIVDIPNALIGNGVDTELDFSSNLNTPISYVNTTQGEDSVRIGIVLSEKAAYNYYAQGNAIVVDFSMSDTVTMDPTIADLSPKPVITEGLSQPATLPGETPSVAPSEVMTPDELEEVAEMAITEEEKKYTGKNITLIFSDADIQQIFMLIAEVSSLNILVDPDVRGNITLRLVNVPWDQALDIILENQNLGMEREGNVIRVARNQTLNAEREAELTSRRALEELEELVTRKIDLSYADLPSVTAVIAPMLSDRGAITEFSQTQSLLITDIPSRLDPIVEIINQLDVATPEIRLEARIVEMNDSFTQELGVNWIAGWNEEATAGDSTIKGAVGTLDNALINLDNYFDPATLIFPNPATTSTLGIGGASVLLGFLDDALRLELQLKALEQMGEAEVIETPKVRVLNNVTAEFIITRSIPIRNVTESSDDTGNVTTSGEVDYQDITTELKITPTISADERIKIEIDLLHETQGEAVILNIGGADNTYYIEDTKELTTEVLVDNRDTIVIGGLYRKDVNETETGFPLLKDVPLFGWAFKTKNTTESRRELLIFLTPTIIREEELMMSETGL
ncbi:MAG: type IV pilus secretin PilQ [Deltaproteobacteria bacterium]|nr:type IV pilus secretin PilQ [Candidatus Zymogenaceae bacterium]